MFTNRFDYIWAVAVVLSVVSIFWTPMAPAGFFIFCVLVMILSSYVSRKIDDENYKKFEDSQI